MPLIVFTSPKGGVGKTTLAAHTAALIARKGFHVLAIDTDPQNALRLHFGLPIDEEEGLFSRLDQDIDWRCAVKETPSGVRLLPYGAAEPRRVLAISAALLDNPDLLITPIRDMLSDPKLVVIADSSPGPSAALMAMTPIADLLMLVLQADAGSAALLPQVATGRVHGRGTLAQRTAEHTALVVNRVELDNPLSAAVLNSMARTLGQRLLGAVCHDDALAAALANRNLLLNKGEGAAEDLAALAEAVVHRARLAVSSGRRPTFSVLKEWGVH